MQSALKKIVEFRNLIVFKWFDFLSFIRNKEIPENVNADFIVSIASYPKRDYLLPAVFENLARQTVKPKRFILVLSKEEYPNNLLPHYLQKILRKGIEVIWTEGNPYAVKKLIPVLQKYPDLDIITFDDENLYGKTVIEKLIMTRDSNPGCVIGHYGKTLHRNGNALNMMYRFPDKATLQTTPFQVYLIGNAGILYPSKSLDAKVLDLTAISQIVPGRGSDIWFWAAAIAKGTKQLCLGTPNDRKLFIPIPENKRTVPRDTPAAEVMEKRFQATIDYFGIREILLTQLPDRNV